MNEKNKPQRSPKTTKSNKPKKTTLVKTQSVGATKVDIIKRLEAKVADKKNKDSSVLDKVLYGVIIAQILVLIYMLVK
jgi:cell division protein FtsL